MSKEKEFWKGIGVIGAGEKLLFDLRDEMKLDKTKWQQIHVEAWFKEDFIDGIKISVNGKEKE